MRKQKAALHMWQCFELMKLQAEKAGTLWCFFFSSEVTNWKKYNLQMWEILKRLLWGSFTGISVNHPKIACLWPAYDLWFYSSNITQITSFRLFSLWSGHSRAPMIQLVKSCDWTVSWVFSRFQEGFFIYRLIWNQKLPTKMFWN